VPDYNVPTQPDDQRRAVEQAIEAAGFSPYHQCVARNILREESCAAALNYIETIRELAEEAASAHD